MEILNDIWFGRINKAYIILLWILYSVIVRIGSYAVARDVSSYFDFGSKDLGIILIALLTFPITLLVHMSMWNARYDSAIISVCFWMSFFSYLVTEVNILINLIIGVL